MMMLNPLPPDEYDAVDKAALERAMKIATRDPLVAEQLRSKLDSEPWALVAEFAAYHCQTRALGLKPWQSPPCAGRDDDAEASALLDRMLAAGVSQWDPDPVKALARAKRRR